MARQWQSQDPEGTEQAFLAIPVSELAPLLNGMRAHQDGLGGGYILRSQRGGIWAIKASAQSRAVCLFFASRKGSEMEILTIVGAFTMDSGEIPKDQLLIAHRRRQRPLRVEPKSYLDRLITTCRARLPGFGAEWGLHDIIHELVRIRLAKHLTQEQVADCLGLPRTRITEIERRPGRTSFRRIVAYAAVLNASLMVVPENRP